MTRTRRLHFGESRRPPPGSVSPRFCFLVARKGTEEEVQSILNPAKFVKQSRKDRDYLAGTFWQSERLRERQFEIVALTMDFSGGVPNGKTFVSL
jgi:hypothetical protein